jgi:hypothetical protein
MTKQGKHRRNLLLGHRRTENYQCNKKIPSSKRSI